MGSTTIRLLAGTAALVAALAAGAAMLSWALQLGSSHAPTAAVSPLAAAQPRGDGWALWGTRADGTPLRWDPCRPVRWTTRPSDPAWVGELAATAFATLSRDTGLDFVRVASDDAPIGSARPTTSDDGENWRPVLVTLTTPAEGGWITDEDRALAVPIAIDGVFVTGQVFLNADVDGLAPDFSSRVGSWGATLLHETGHLVGLDHVDQPDQLMFSHPVPGPAAYADGDRRGLAVIARHDQCVPVPPPRDVDIDEPRRRSTERAS